MMTFINTYPFFIPFLVTLIALLMMIFGYREVAIKLYQAVPREMVTDQMDFWHKQWSTDNTKANDIPAALLGALSDLLKADVPEDSEITLSE